MWHDSQEDSAGKMCKKDIVMWQGGDVWTVSTSKVNKKRNSLFDNNFVTETVS
jgi:hypothetical protein